MTDAPLSRLAIARGTAMALILAMPAALANVVLADQEPKPRAALNLTLLVLLIAFGVGGSLAGREAPSQSAKHGALAAFAAFVPVQVVGIMGRLDRGEPIAVGQAIVIGMLAACAGTLGAQVGARRRARKQEQQP